MHDGRFRQDLFYRLNTLRITVPPLREREGDAVILAQHFVQQFANKYRKPGLSLSPAAQARIAAYDWPGNVRELRNIMEQAILHCDGAQIMPQHIAIMASPPSTAPAYSSTSYHPAPVESLARDGSDNRLADAERALIEKTLGEVDGNISKAARQLGISRDRLRYRLKKYGLGS